MASEQVRYVQYLLLLLHFLCFSASVCYEGGDIVIFRVILYVIQYII